MCMYRPFMLKWCKNDVLVILWVRLDYWPRRTHERPMYFISR